jgi:uncharacterized protein (DUF2249 family)
MLIYRDTKISKLIKANKDCIEAIASVAKPFEKLRNPVLRKVLAGRTTLAEAAKIGKCDIQVLAEALKPLGFELANNDAREKDTKGASASVPAFAGSLDKFPKMILDVREDLASGSDPLKKIMAAISKLPSGNILQVINTFEPTPLISLLDKKGFESFVERKGPDEVYTYFKSKQDAIKNHTTESELPELSDEHTFAAKRAFFGTRVVEIDVSGMEMPMPMVTILESLSKLEDGYVLSVAHKRVPVFLFSELKERDFDYLIYKAGDTDVRLLIWKKENDE